MEDTREQIIEDIAWEVFKEKLNLSFKRELTPKEKKSITDKPEFDYYREEAVKIFNKKQLALLKERKYPIIDVPASGVSRMMGGAFSLLFVFSKYDGNFIIRGYGAEAEEYLKKNYTHYFYNHAMFHAYRSRNLWKFWKKDVGIFEPETGKRFLGSTRRTKWEVREYSNLYLFDSESDKDEAKKEKKSIKFKRLPKRWIPEFDKF